MTNNWQEDFMRRNLGTSRRIDQVRTEQAAKAKRRRLRRMTFTPLAVIVGIVLTALVVWFLPIGGIVQAVHAFNGPTIDATGLAVGIVRVFCTGLGMGAAWLLAAGIGALAAS